MVKRSQKSRSPLVRKISHDKGGASISETLYAAGAETVIAAVIYPGRPENNLPTGYGQTAEGKGKRKALRKICQDLCAQRGGALLPDEKDMGESHLFINLE